MVFKQREVEEHAVSLKTVREGVHAIAGKCKCTVIATFERGRSLLCDYSKDMIRKKPQRTAICAAFALVPCKNHSI